MSPVVYPDNTPYGSYTNVSNDVLEKIADIELTRPERKVLTRIIRNTIGYVESTSYLGDEFKRVTSNFAMEYLVENTGLSEEEIKTALASLEDRRIIKRDGDRITFNHHLDEWV